MGDSGVAHFYIRRLISSPQFYTHSISQETAKTSPANFLIQEQNSSNFHYGELFRKIETIQKTQENWLFGQVTSSLRNIGI
jgi:hypothetical protein